MIIATIWFSGYKSKMYQARHYVSVEKWHLKTTKLFHSFYKTSYYQSFESIVHSWYISARSIVLQHPWSPIHLFSAHILTKTNGRVWHQHLSDQLHFITDIIFFVFCQPRKATSRGQGSPKPIGYIGRHLWFLDKRCADSNDWCGDISQDNWKLLPAGGAQWKIRGFGSDTVSHLSAQELSKHFIQNLQCQPQGGARGKVTNYEYFL